MDTWEGVGWLSKSMPSSSALDMISIASSSEDCAAGFLADFGVFFLAADGRFDPAASQTDVTDCLGGCSGERQI